MANKLIDSRIVIEEHLSKVHTFSFIKKQITDIKSYTDQIDLIIKNMPEDKKNLIQQLVKSIQDSLNNLDVENIVEVLAERSKEVLRMLEK